MPLQVLQPARRRRRRRRRWPALVAAVLAVAAAYAGWRYFPDEGGGAQAAQRAPAAVGATQAAARRAQARQHVPRVRPAVRTLPPEPLVVERGRTVFSGLRLAPKSRAAILVDAG